MAEEPQSKPRVRLFVALDLPASVREGIAAWGERELRDPALRPVAADSLHVTLAFLGHRDEAEVGPIGELVDASGGRGAAIELGEPEARPGRGRPRVFALPARSEGAETLQAGLVGRLEAAGLFEAEKRPFWPHVTVARVRNEGGGTRRPMAVSSPLDPCRSASWSPSLASGSRSTVLNSSHGVRDTSRWPMSSCPQADGSEVIQMADKKVNLKDASAKEAKAKDAALEAAVTQIERDFGQGSLMRLGDKGTVKVEAIPTGALALDLALGIGGVPRGRIVEIFGPESSGKTTLVNHIIAQAQALGGVCAFIDTEHSIDPVYSRAIGVDTDELLVSQPDYGEQALQIADRLIASGAIDVVAIDSVAALTPKAELDGQIGDTTVGLQARLMSQALRKLAGNLNRTKTVCVFTNQIREKIGVQFGSPETQPGGRALKFYASQRLDIRRIETLKEGTEAVGNRVRVKVVKNKVAAPFRQAEFDIEYGVGISREGSLLDFGIEQDLVQKSGSFFSYGETRLGQGRNNAKQFLVDNPEFAMEIETKVRAALGIDGEAPVAPEADEAPIAEAKAA